MLIYQILFKGFLTSAGLIMAIGAQNAFVIKQSLSGRHLLFTACMCACCDAFLISLGLFGMGKILVLLPGFELVSKIGAIIYLLIYAAFSFRSAMQQSQQDNSKISGANSIFKTFAILCALTFLNPHAYLDAVILLGSVAQAQPAGMSHYFAIGAIMASFVWFFFLTYGSARFATHLQGARVQRILDIIVGCVMTTIALSLTLSFF